MPQWAIFGAATHFLYRESIGRREQGRCHLPPLFWLEGARFQTGYAQLCVVACFQLRQPCGCWWKRHAVAIVVHRGSGGVLLCMCIGRAGNSDGHGNQYLEKQGGKDAHRIHRDCRRWLSQGTGRVVAVGRNVNRLHATGWGSFRCKCVIGFNAGIAGAWADQLAQGLLFQGVGQPAGQPASGEQHQCG